MKKSYTFSLAVLACFITWVGFPNASLAGTCVSVNGKPMIRIGDDNNDFPLIDPRKCGLPPIKAPVRINPDVPPPPPVNIIDIPERPPLPPINPIITPPTFSICSIMQKLGLKWC